MIIIGGGFGGIHAIKGLKNKGFQVVLFDRQNYHSFQPLLYQVATAGLHPEAIVAPLRTVFRGHEDFHFRLCDVSAIDPDRKIVFTPSGELAFDYLIISAGSRPNYFGNEEIEANVLPLKTVPDAISLRNKFMMMIEKADMTADAADRRRIMSVVLVGGGSTGVEMAGALAELREYVLRKDYPALDLEDMRVFLVEAGDRLLPAMSQKAGKRAKRDLEKIGVTVCLSSAVEAYDGLRLQIKGAEPIFSSTVVWTAGVRSISIEGIKAGWIERGRIVTDRWCRIPEDKSIFVIGDMALMKGGRYPNGLPGVTQGAIQTGTFVGKNLARLHEGYSVKPFNYFNRGDLATIGRRKAVLDLPAGIFIGGRIAWYIWLFIHITYLDSFRNRLLVFSTWLWNYFTYDKGNRLIIDTDRRPQNAGGGPETRQCRLFGFCKRPLVLL